jgi:hypothetical protein
MEIIVQGRVTNVIKTTAKFDRQSALPDTPAAISVRYTEGVLH